MLSCSGDDVDSRTRGFEEIGFGLEDDADAALGVGVVVEAEGSGFERSCLLKRTEEVVNVRLPASATLLRAMIELAVALEISVVLRNIVEYSVWFGEGGG